MNFKKMPGSHKTRHRAATILTATLTDPSGIWVVTGGDASHTVTAKPEENTFSYACDCGHVVEFCSHEIAVMRFLEPRRLIRSRRPEDET